MKPVILSVISLGMVWFVPEAVAPITAKKPANLQEYLALSDQQRQNLEQIQTQMREKARASVHELEDKQKALRTHLASGDADALAVGKLVIALELAKTKAQATSEELQSQARAQLTATQLAKLQALEAAQSLQPVVREAMGMFLLAPPPAVLKGTGPLGMFTAPRRGQQGKKDGVA